MDFRELSDTLLDEDGIFEETDIRGGTERILSESNELLDMISESGRDDLDDVYYDIIDIQNDAGRLLKDMG